MRNDVIVDNENYIVTADSVIMGNSIAYSPNAHTIITNCHPHNNDSIPNVVKFRLSIGDQDNELLPTRCHYLDLDNITDSTVVKAFVADSTCLKPSHNIIAPSMLKLKIDMSEIYQSFNEKDFYVTPTHDTIYSLDFENAQIEMVIDIDSSRPSHKIRIDNMPNQDGIYNVALSLPPTQPRKFNDWNSLIDESSQEMPFFSSKQTILDALYNMSIEQVMMPEHNQHSPLIASECYAIALALAYLEPEKSMESLKAMVENNIISTEQGTKSFSALVNDLIWSQAAWSVYCATNDKGWLRYAYKVIINSINQEKDLLINNDTGLFHAMCPYTTNQVSQYYPVWMTTSDAFETSPLVANAIIEHTYRLLGLIADEFELNENYDVLADRIKDAINHRLWNESSGCYTQYLYGGVTNMMSPCVDNMGQAISILWDIADDDRAETLINSTPITNFGTPLTYPNRAKTGNGLNNTVVPMVQALWNLAAAKTNNMSALRRGMGSLIYQQALAASCATCCNATSGELLASNNAMGNAAGNIAMILRIIAGMNFLPNGIELSPKVPVCFNGIKTLSNFKYRDAILNITIKGIGDDWSKITLDGKNLDDNFIDGTLTGEHNIVITMSDNYAGTGSVTLAQKTRMLPETPQWLWDGFYGTNYNYDKNLGYKIIINGEPTYSMPDSVLGTRDTVTYRSYSLVAINKYGHSYISKPHYITTTAQCYSLADHAPQLISERILPNSFKRQLIELDNDSSWVDVPIHTNVAGSYIIDVLYSNGNGTKSLLSPCHILQVSANGHNQGVIAVPEVGEQQWFAMRYSTHLTILLLKGENTIRLRRVNLGPIINENPILIDHIRLIKKTV